jgi:recombination protein RecT
MAEPEKKQLTPAQRNFQTLQGLLERNKQKIQMALPKHMTPDRLIRVALTTYLKTPELANCKIESVLESIMEAAALGLEPDGALGHAYLVPYKGACKFIPGYKGYIALFYRSPQSRSIIANVVYERDEFHFAYGIEEELTHKPNLEVDDRGKRLCVYAIAHMADGAHSFVVLPMSRVEELRKRSAAPNSPAWKNDYDAMACKTAVRQLHRWIPQCPELQRAAAREEMMDAGIDPDGVIDVTPGTGNGGADDLASKLRGDGSKGAPVEQDPELLERVNDLILRNNNVEMDEPDAGLDALEACVSQRNLEGLTNEQLTEAEKFLTANLKQREQKAAAAAAREKEAQLGLGTGKGSKSEI